MTQKINSWRENRAKRRYEQEIQNRLETIMYNIFDGLDTEESISIIKNIEALCTNRLESRLINADEEKSRIENFLSV